MSIADTAVGAILEIPTRAMDNIYKAQRAIEGLQVTSRHAADEVSKHWGTTAVEGLTRFIQKLHEANTAIGNFSGKNIKFDMSGVEQQMKQTADATKASAQSISDTAQRLSTINIDTTSFKTIQASIDAAGITFREFENLVRNYEAGRSQTRIDSPEAIAMTNALERLKEFIALKKKSEEQLARTTTPQDKDYLSEQKRLLTDLLNLRKQINEQSTKVQTGRITDSSTIKQDEADLRRLFDRYQDVYRALQNLNAEKGKDLSQAAKTQSEVNAEKYKNDVLKQQLDYREKLASAIIKANEYTALGQQGRSRISNTDEGTIQRQINNDYKAQLKILKEIGEIKAKAAEQGKTLTINSAEVQLIQALAQRYRVYAEDVNRVASAYRAMGEAAAKNFAADRSEQLARNAIMLADAQKKAEGNTKQLTAEYKKLYAENQRLFESQRKYFNEGGGTPQSITTGTAPQDQAYRDMEARRQDVLQRMDEIERKNIQEIADFRLQKEMEANQKIISDFVQAEAQKKAAAEKSAQEQADAQKRRLQEYLQTAQGAMWQARQVTSGKGTGDLATNLENIKRAINDLKAASGNLNLLNPADVQKAEQLKKKIAELETLLKKYKDAATPDKPVISPQDAINAAKNATTLKQLEKAYKGLKEAMSGVDSSKPIWSQMNTQLGQTKKQIDDIKKKMGEFHNEVQKTSNIMGQLQSRIAAAFSVGAIMGFAKKVTEVRAQFELQRVALGAIIQDKDEANKVFLRVQQMALESPFSIMQLERSTKQIAAFGFEAKQLVPTMKMVADIGAGLGVELDRIVLVLGHMRARGYLEGTMIRQFTNMGFNVLGELAKYYTELEGRMVSVADVQERVKKKMVEFGDVEEVLKRVTSAGGMFYDMQRKQSDSIWGQMQRITDAYDLMLNEIGQSNEGSIKAALTAIRTLINSWRTLAPLIVSTVASVGSFFTVSIAMKVLPKLILGMSTAMQLFRRQITIAEIKARGLNNALLSNPYAAITAAVVGLGVALLQVATAQSKLNEELERTQSEGISDMYGLIFQYRTLADTVKDSTKSYDERKKALDDINRVYKDILPDYMTEIKYIKSITDGYKDATDAIKAYSEAKIRKNMQEAVENEYGKHIQEAITVNAERFTENVYDAFSELPQLEKIDRDTFKGAVSNIMTGIAEEVKAGTLPIEKASDDLQKRVLATFNISKEDYAKVSKDIAFGLNAAFKGAFGDVNTWWSDIFGFGMKSGLKSVIMDMNEEKGKITNLGLTSTVMEEDAQPAIDQYHNLEKAVAEYTSALEALYDRKAELEKQGKTFGNVGLGEIDGKQTFTFPGADAQSQDAMDEVHHKVYLLQQAIAAYGYEYKISMNEINRALQSNMDQTEFMGTVNQNVLQSILKDFQKWGGELTKNDYMAAFVENALKNMNLLTEPQKRIINIARKVSTANGVAMSSFDLLKISAATNYTDAAKEAKKLSDQAADNIKKIAATRTQLLLLAKLNKQILTPEQAQMQAENMWGGGMTEEQLKKYQAAMEQTWKALGGYEKKSNKKSGGSKSDKELKRWQDLKKVIEDVKTGYEKLRKSFSESETNRQIDKLYGKTFEELGFKITDFYKDGKYGAESLIEAEKVLLGLTRDNTEERKKFRSELQRSMADTQVEIDVKLKEDSEKKLKSDIDKMFDNYELSKTLKDANIPINLVPMVGGEPIQDLDELRDRIQAKYDAAGGKSASDNDVKMYEDAMKKINDMEAKQQQERLKSYQQYLAEMYSNRAQTMIKSYTAMKNMERDFAAYRENLEKEAADSATTESRKRQIAEQIRTLESQAKDAIDGVRAEMDQKLNQFDWNAFKGSPVFTQMYSDLQTLSKKGIDMLIVKLTAMRDKLQAMSDVDYRAVREMTQYIEKLNTQRIELDSWKELDSIIKQSYDLRKQGYDMDTAQKNLMDAQSDLDAATAEIDNLNTIINLKRQEGEESDKKRNLSVIQLALYGESDAVLQNMLKNAEANANAAQENVNKWNGVVQTHKNAKAALEAQLNKVQMLKDNFDTVYDSALSVADALGADTEIWGDFAKGIGDSIFQVIILTIQLQIMGVAANSALGIIGYVVIALQAIANLLGAIFAAHDKSLQKQIEVQEDKVEMLQRAYDKLKDSIDNAFKASSLQSDSRKAIQNLEEQKKATEEMIRLEEQKKKTDNDQIKQWREDIADINDKMQELKDDITEKWGGFGSQGNYASAAEEFASAWLDAFKETGDGLDALNDKWDEYIDNLMKQQIMLRVIGPKMEQLMKMVDKYVSADSEQGELLTRNELEQLLEAKNRISEMANEELKALMEYLGYGGGTGDYVLSDLQKGIQNITEPQAAAIEAYLNSMRFAVFRHTEQLDTLIQIVGAQYGVGVDNPVVTELKGIRIVLDTIDRRLDSVIETKAGIGTVLRIG